MASATHNSRAAVFLGRGLRRTETRFCARRNGDSFSASKSSRRASSSSSRAVSSDVEYNSSWMVVPLLRAINRSVVVGTAEQFHYNFIRTTIEDKSWCRFAQEGWVSHQSVSRRSSALSRQPSATLGLAVRSQIKSL